MKRNRVLVRPKTSINEKRKIKIEVVEFSQLLVASLPFFSTDSGCLTQQIQITAGTLFVSICLT